MPYLFDGYNLYHAMRKVSEEFASLTPKMMSAVLSEDLKGMKEKGIIVFDGRALRGDLESYKQMGPVTILYSGVKSDADTRIEELIKDNTAPKRLVVVSSDHRIKRAGRRRRAKILTSLEYIDALFYRLSRPAPVREPKEKRLGVEQGQLDQWLDLFGIEKEDPSDDPMDWVL